MTRDKDKPTQDPLEPAVAPLSDEERRKMFDLPAPTKGTAAPPPPLQRREERLELDVEKGPARVVAQPAVIDRITVGGAVSQAASIARLVLAGLLFGAGFAAVILFVYR